VEISQKRLTENFRRLADAAGAEICVLAVVKADAYGHGVASCSRVLARVGAGWLGVTDAAEGAEVRSALTAAGVPIERQPRVLVMSGLLGEEAVAVVEHQLTPVVWTVEQMEWLAVAVGLRGVTEPLAVHLEVDTGMARQGAAPGSGAGEDLGAVLRWLAGQRRLQLEGVMTHFASAEVAGSQQTYEQQRGFEQAMAQVANSGLQPAWVHAGNSSTIDNAATSSGASSSLAWLAAVAARAGARAMVRSGLGLYGYCLPIEREGGFSGAAEAEVRPRLQPVMTWKTRVIGVRDVEPGATVGYNGTFVAERPMRLALLPLGYADGLRRELSATNTRPGGWVMFGGERASFRAQIVGRVSMNLTVVDVTGLNAVAVGDEVVVLGDGVTAEDHARLAETIPYEIVCGVRGTRVLC
jgi:alanine racemase